MTDSMNTKRWNHGTINLVDISHNHQERGQEKGAVYILAGDAGIGAALDLSQAIEAYEHLGEIIREVQEAKPKEPTNAEIIEAMKPGTAFRYTAGHLSYVYYRQEGKVLGPYGSDYQPDAFTEGKIEVL